MFDEFIASFCKVEFLCYAGDPNWLGWIVLVGGSIIGFSWVWNIVNRP